MADKLMEKGFAIKGPSSTVEADVADTIRKTVLRQANAELVEKPISAAGLEIVHRTDLSTDGGHAFARQLAWRDFHHQLLAARPEAVRAYNSPLGVTVLAVGFVVTVIAYRIMLAMGRLPEERRWFA